MSFADREVNLNRMTFRLVSTTQREADEIPAEPELLATYPNPFSEVVHISFSTPEPVTAVAVLYDVLGRQVYQADEAAYSAGSHEISMPGLALAPGVYVLRLILDGPGLSKTITRPLVAAK